MAYWLSNNIKIIDLGGPWRSLTTSTVGYPSDSWASCIVLDVIKIDWQIDLLSAVVCHFVVVVSLKLRRPKRFLKSGRNEPTKSTRFIRTVIIFFTSARVLANLRFYRRFRLHSSLRLRSRLRDRNFLGMRINRPNWCGLSAEQV